MKRNGKVLLAAGALSCAGWYWMENRWLKTTHLSLPCMGLPKSFEGFRVIQISDLHGARYGREQSVLLKKIAAFQPDLILLTGDLLCSRREALSPALELARGCRALAPCCYVSGNHEARMPLASMALERMLSHFGVQVLEDRIYPVRRKGDCLAVMGLADGTGRTLAPVHQRLQMLMNQTGSAWPLLLSHRPELMDLYAAAGVPLVFSGHAHGGQICLPGIGGLFAPDQGLFPQYTTGVYRNEKTLLVVSRGTGPSQFPFRMGNRPEILLATLHCCDKQI